MLESHSPDRSERGTQYKREKKVLDTDATRIKKTEDKTRTSKGGGKKEEVDVLFYFYLLFLFSCLLSPL